MRMAAESDPALGSVIAIADPALAELRLLLVGPHRAERGVAETLARDRQREADVAPAELHHAEDGGDVARRCVVRGCVGRLGRVGVPA